MRATAWSSGGRDARRPARFAPLCRPLRSPLSVRSTRRLNRGSCSSVSPDLLCIPPSCAALVRGAEEPRSTVQKKFSRDMRDKGTLRVTQDSTIG